MGFHYSPQSFSHIVNACIFATLPTLWLEVHSDRPSTLIYYLVYFLVYIPSCIVPPLILGTGLADYMPYQLTIMAGLTIMGLGYRLPLLNIVRPRLAQPLYWKVVAGCTLGTVGLVSLHFDIANLHVPSWGLEFYEIRSDFKETIGTASAVTAYALMWQSKVVGPLLFLHALQTKNPLWAGVSGGVQLLIFLVTGVKTVLFSLIMLLGFYLMLSVARRGLLTGTLIALLCVVCGSALIDTCLDQETPIVTGTLVRRNMFIPGLLTAYYYDFFSENPKQYMANAFLLRHFVDSPYQVSAAQTIGLEYFGSYEASANANLWSDSYANLGLIGIPIYSLVLAVVLWIFDSLSTGVDRRLATVLLAMPAMAIVNTGMLTVLLSHGLVLAMLAMFLYPTDENSAADTKGTLSDGSV
ncbi:MAG: hypothetical protein WD049_04575 [Candidatus Paceibacterota bacterium]